MNEIGQNGKDTADWIDWIEQGGRGRGVGVISLLYTYH